MQFKVQWSDCEVDIDNSVGFAQDKEGTIWYFSEHGEQFTVFDGTITIGN